MPKGFKKIRRSPPLRGIEVTERDRRILSVVRSLRLATRGSEQARAQSEAVAKELQARTGIPVELVFLDTMGDLIKDRPLAEIGGRGVFVKEIQRAVQDGHADFAVHSAKDLPSSFHAPGLVLACVPVRGDARDGIVGHTVADLAHGATVATGSQRRQSQLAHRRPDLRFVGLRGNIPTRVAKADLPGIDASLVAVAGARWVGLEHRLAQCFSVDEMVPQIGQGALALECRVDDAVTLEALAMLQDASSRRCVEAERSFLAHLGGGCELPVGAHALVDHDGTITITGVIASLDGRQYFRSTRSADHVAVGAELAAELLAAGAARLL
jgi:hydroxymethylbilane synthase